MRVDNGILEQEETKSNKTIKNKDTCPEWCKDIDYSKIPLVPRSPRGEGKETISFRAMPRLIRMAQIIREDKPLSCYKTLSDVYHHAFYLGLQLIYNRGYKDGVEPEYGKTLRELILKNEQFVGDAIIKEEIIATVQKMEEQFHKGHIGIDALQKSIEEFIDSAPEHLQREIQEELNEIILLAQRKDRKERKRSSR